MELLLLGFYRRVPLCKLYRVEYIVRILSYGFYRADSIVRILLCEIHRAIVRSIVRIQSYGFYRALHLADYRGFYRADSIVRILLCVRSISNVL